MTPELLADLRAALQRGQLFSRAYRNAMANPKDKAIIHAYVEGVEVLLARIDAEAGGWRPIATRPSFMEAPCRQFILIDGHKWHSGVRWARRWHGKAAVDGTSPHGYREADIRRILADGDMDADGWEIPFWLPAAYPDWPAPPSAPGDAPEAG